MLIYDDEPGVLPEPDGLTQCLSWPGADDAPEVRCLTPAGQAISLCGHGLIGCGTTWTQLGRPASAMLMNHCDVRFSRDGDLSWVGFEPMDCEECAVPEWVAGQFASAPESAATAGGEAGYLILRWADDADLRSLPVPGAELKKVSARAVIATCADTEHAGLDIRQRYFAPQHGVAEDSATGSAMRVLASFWQRHASMDQLRAWQCSPVGGHLFSRMEAGLTWVGGRVQAEANDVVNG